MRRAKKTTTKIIILVIMSGIFNLLSYTFDQLVIQAELKNRNLERKLVSNRIKLETLSYEITTLNDLSFEVIRATNYFRKHLPTNLYGSLSFLGENPESKFLWQDIYSKQAIKKIGSNFLINLKEMIVNFNKKTDEVDKIFKSIFPEPIFYNALLGKYFPIKEIKIDLNILDGFDPSFSDDEKLQAIKDEKNWKIYTQIYKKIEDFKTLDYQFSKYLKRSENKYVEQFAIFFNFIDEYAEEQNKINYFILLSIISQILGILFILLLFKSLISNKNSSHV